MQLTSGVLRLLSHPDVYRLFRNLTGAERLMAFLCQQYIRARPGQVVLDVGCGPADVLAWLPEGVKYYGVDISREYLRAAERRWGTRGRFLCVKADELAQAEIPPCDIALLLGVAHHLDDTELVTALRQIRGLMKPQARLITYDPCFTTPQNPLARLVHRLDRGRNVRFPEELAALVGRVFAQARWTVRTDLCRIPASVLIFEAQKQPAPSPHGAGPPQPKCHTFRAAGSAKPMDMGRR